MEVSREATNTQDIVGTTLQGLIVLAYFSHVSKPASWTQAQSFRPLFDKVRQHLESLEIPLYDYDIAVNEFLEDHIIHDSCHVLSQFFTRIQRWQREELKTDVKMSPILVKMLDDAKRMAAGSTNAFREVKTNVGLLKNKDLTSLFVSKDMPDRQRIDAFIKRISKLVGYLGGTGNDLTADERKVATKTKPNMYKEFLDLRREMTQQSKSFVQDWVRSHADSDGLVDYQQMLGELNTYFPIHNFPSGFVGKIDDMGRPHTEGGELIQSFPQGGVVIMNPQYDPKLDDSYVFRSQGARAAGYTWHYTMKNRSKSKRNTFKVVRELDENIEGIRDKWRRELQRIDDTPTNDQKYAMILEIIYQTQARIGSDKGSTKVDGADTKTFGLSVIQYEHLKFRGDKLYFKYLGKKAQVQKHILERSMGREVRSIIDAIERWSKDKKPEDAVFTKGRGAAIRGTDINKYLRSLGAPKKVTIHKFRHLKGTRMMDEIIQNHPFKDQPADTAKVKKWLQKEAEAIGAKLGHFSGEKVTGTTALAAYVSPKALLQVYKDAQSIPHPSLLRIVGIDPKAVNFDIDQESDESASTTSAAFKRRKTQFVPALALSSFMNPF